MREFMPEGLVEIGKVGTENHGPRPGKGDTGAPSRGAAAGHPRQAEGVADQNEDKRGRRATTKSGPIDRPLSALSERDTELLQAGWRDHRHLPDLDRAGRGLEGEERES